jgi:hypothetical protein
MSQTFSSNSSQNFITVYYSSTLESGTEIKVTDKDGNLNILIKIYKMINLNGRVVLFHVFY